MAHNLATLLNCESDYKAAIFSILDAAKIEVTTVHHDVKRRVYLATVGGTRSHKALAFNITDTSESTFDVSTQFPEPKWASPLESPRSLLEKNCGVIAESLQHELDSYKKRLSDANDLPVGMTSVEHEKDPYTKLLTSGPCRASDLPFPIDPPIIIVHRDTNLSFKSLNQYSLRRIVHLKHLLQERPDFPCLDEVRYLSTLDGNQAKHSVGQRFPNSLYQWEMFAQIARLYVYALTL
jgi:hypothetical protein